MADQFDRLESRVDTLSSDTQALSIEVAKLSHGQETLMERISEDRADRREYREHREASEQAATTKAWSDPRLFLILIAVVVSILCSHDCYTLRGGPGS